MDPNEEVVAGSRSDAVFVDVVSGAAGVPSGKRIARWVSRALAEARPGERRPFEASVRIVDRDEIRTLNREFRRRDTATNVLSFPAGELQGLPHEQPLLLGDVVVCAPVVAEEAVEQGKAADAHWAHLLVHGALHLLGYDHEDPADAEVMEALEVRILGGLGVADPYS